jgi:2-amino-4-hydroxy-6-hydroxymethyldihydropteridine diphosphokinase
MKKVRTYIGIGSNLGDPRQQVVDALKHLGQIRNTSLEATSSLYLTEPVGDIPQDDYINAVVCLLTSLSPTELLLELQAIEHAFYRQRVQGQQWAPRSMDLDIILYDTLHLQDSHLTIPHPEMQNRLFVLQPLQEIAGDLYIPTLGSLQYMIQQAPATRIEKLAG